MICFCFSILSSVLPVNRNNLFISWVIIAEEMAEEAEEKHGFCEKIGRKSLIKSFVFSFL